MKDRLNKIYNKNSLLVNSLNLMIASGVTALFGFIFWILIARFFDTRSVGLATTLLSTTSLISILGLAGFDTLFVRYLPHSERKNDQINSGLIMAALAAAIFSLFFALLIPVISPKLKFVSQNPVYVICFIVTTIFATWNTLTNSVFIAYRKTSYVLWTNIAFSVFKMSLPLIFHSGGPMTIFILFGIAQLFNVILSVYFMMKKLGYSPSPKIHFDILKTTRKYSLSVYISNVFNLTPDFVLPIIIVDKLGASASAYFYIAYTIANLVYTIAFSVTQVLLAEASHDQVNAFVHLRKGLAISFIMITPAILAVFLLGHLVLGVFGHEYAQSAVNLLRVLSISGFVIILYTILETNFRYTKNLSAMISMTFTRAITIVAMSFFIANHYGLIGIGWSWFVGGLASVVVGLSVNRSRTRLINSKLAYWSKGSHS